MVRKNEDMAGSISEPKPAKSLWPRPYESVRVEPSLEPPSFEEGSIETPRVAAPAGDFDTVPSEGYQEHPEPEPDFPKLENERIYTLSADNAPAVEEPSDPEPASVPEPVIEQAPHVSARREPEIAREPEPDFLRMREDERTAAVFDAADHQKPALVDPGESGVARFVAMAAGIVVALALGGTALVYGASALGFKLNGLGKPASTDAASSPPPAVPVAAAPSDEELKAAQTRIKELEDRLKAIEDEKKSAAAEPSAPAPAPAPPQNTASLPPQEPAATPAPPANEQAASPAPSSTPTPTASAANTAPPAPARAEPTPAPKPAAPAAASAPKQLGDPPRTLDEQRRETARIETPPAPPPTPRYDTRPSYNDPGSAASPEMPVLQNWAVRDVYNGIAVVQSGRGAPMEVEPGDTLPGGNRVLAIRRLGGDWAVITERGIIAGY